MELQLVGKEVAVLAKELGFNIKTSKCIAKTEKKELEFLWSDALGEEWSIIAFQPEQELLAKWLRDVHNIYCNLETIDAFPVMFISEIRIYNPKDPKGITRHAGLKFSHYEHAMEDALFRALSHLKIIQTDSK